MDTLGPANFTVMERFSSLRSKIVLSRYCRDHRSCPLYRGALYSECPLREVPLYNTVHIYLFIYIYACVYKLY